MKKNKRIFRYCGEEQSFACLIIHKKRDSKISRTITKMTNSKYLKTFKEKVLANFPLFTLPMTSYIQESQVLQPQQFVKNLPPKQIFGQT